MTGCRNRLLLLLALPLLLAPLPGVCGTAAQSAPQNIPQPTSTPETAPPAALVTPAASVPVLPSPAELRAMTPADLDHLGDRLRAAKDYLGALDCYRAAIRKHPEARYYNKVAISQIMLRHPAEAVKAAKKAVRKDRNLAEAWNNLGVAYYLGNHLEDAIGTYARAIRIDPEKASFHNNLAAALMDHKEYDKGIEEYRRAFALDPEFFEHSAANGISARMGSPKDRAQFSFVMARLFASAGNLDRALHFLRAALEDGYPQIDDVYKVKEFAGLLKDERFVALMKDRPLAIR